MMTHWISRLTDLLAPRPCAVCGRRLTPEESTLCMDCLLRLPFTNFEHTPFDNAMARLFWGQLPMEKAAALFYHTPHSPAAQVIYDLKYHSRPQYGRQLGVLTGSRFLPTGFFDGMDAIVAVPLAPARQRERGYNQSDAIVEGLCRATGLPSLARAVVRTGFTASQTQQQSRQERMENVEGAFRLRRPDHVAGHHLLLVDDVVTTGATMLAVGKALQEAGNVKFSLLSLGFTQPL